MDAAFYLQANTFRGTTTLQLQLIDLRPSLTPSRHEAADLDLCRRCCEGERLTPQERSRLRTSREQFGTYWTLLERQLHQLRQSQLEDAELPFLRRLAAAAGGNESFLRAVLALEVFTERGLLDMDHDAGRLRLRLIPAHGKVNLAACPYLERLDDPVPRKN